MLWLMILKGPRDWQFIKAEGPCWKGEIRASFRWFSVVLGWQAAARAAGLEADEG